MADNSYKNSIMLGVRLPQANDIQSQLNSLIKELNNSKIQLDVGFKDNSIVQTIEKLNNILNQTKQSANNVNLNNISNVLKQVSEEATKLSGDLKNVSSVNIKVSDGELKSLKVTMQDTENESKKLNQSLKDTNNGNWFSGMGDFLSKAGLFYGVGQAVSELKQQFSSAFDQAERLNQAFTDISITMDITKEQFSDMSNKITQMGIEYGKSGNEVMQIAKTYANAQSSVEEVMAKVKPDLFLANVSRMDSADITKTIQAVSNQFELMTKEGMNAEQATTKVGNSLVAVSKNLQYDFVDGIKKITEAVKVGGSVANNAKMSLDDFLSMTGAFIQQSGMSGSEFSNALKSISARVLKQKELGEELGLQTKDYAEAEQALKRFDITTRDTTTGGLRSLTDILRDVSLAFNKMTDSDRQYMALKLSGVNQSARFIDIMKSMQNQQLLYNKTQTDSTALMDAQAKYSESLEGRIGSLKATYEGLQNKMLTSDTAKWLVTEATQFLNILGQVDGKTIAFIATVGSLIVVVSKLVTINKELMEVMKGEAVATGLTKLVGVMTGMISLEGGVTGLAGAFQLLKGGIVGATESAIAFMATPVGLVIGAISAVIGVAVAGFTAYKQHQEELTQQSKELREALEGVNTALANGDTKTASMTADKMREEQKALTDLINKRKELESSPEPNTSDYYKSMGGADKAQSIALVTQKIDEQIKKIKDAGMTVDETSGKIQELANVESQIVNQNIVDKIKAETKAQVDHRENVEANTESYNNYISTIQKLYSQYQTLSAQENLSSEQKTELANVVEQLQGKIGNLDVQMDSNGKTYITNQGLISDTISYMNTEGETVQVLTQIKLADQKSNATWQWNNTTLTYQQTLQRIQYYRSEIAEIQKLMQARLEEASQVISHKDADGNYDVSDDKALQAEKEYMLAKRAGDARIKAANDNINSLQAGISNIDKLYTSMELPSPSKGGGDYLTANPSSGGSSKKSKADTEAEKAQKLREEIDALQSDIKPDRYLDLNNAIKSLDGELEVNKSLQDSLEKGSPEYRQAQQQEIDLDKQKQVALQNLNNEQKKEAQEMKDRLSSMSFQFDANGRLINSQQRLLEMQESINAESGDTEEAKKKKQDDIKWLKDLQKYTEDYTNLVGDKIPKTTAEWNKLGNEIKNTVGDMEKADEDALQKLRENLVDGLKKQREKEKEDELQALEDSYDRKKKRIQAEYDEEKKRLEDQKSALQKQISDLEDSKEDKAGKLAELQKEYEGWSRDNSSYAKKNKDDLAKEIKDLTIDIQKDTLQKQVDSIDEQEKDTDTYYKNELSNAEEHYNKMKKKKETYYKNLLDDKQLYSDADVLITKNSNDEMLKILNDSSESYKQVGTLLGENFKDGLLKQLNEAKEALKDLQNIKAEKASSGGSSGSSSSSSGSHKTTYNDDGSKSTTGTTSEGISYTKETDSSGKSVVYASKPFDTSEISSYATGGMTPSNISNNGALAVLHKDEKILNADDTVKFDNSMDKISGLYDYIMNSGSLINQLSQTYSNPNNYIMPSVSSDLNRAVSSIVNNNNNGGNISANFYNTFNNSISSNVDANKFNNDAVKQLKSELNYISNRFRK